MKPSVKKKLKVLTSIPIIAGIFVLIYISLGMIYFNKNDKSNDLESKIALKKAALQRPAPSIKELNSQLSDSKSELETIMTSLPYPGQGIDIYTILVDLGRKWNVEIMNINALPPILTEGSESTPTMPYHFTIQGSQNDTLSFISSLIQGRELLQGLELIKINILSDVNSEDLNTVGLEIYVHAWPDVIPEIEDIG